METLKKLLVVSAGYMLAVFDPIAGMVYALLMSMAANCFIGILADKSQGRKYSFKKMFKAFKEYAFITGGAFFSANICYAMGSMDSGVVVMKTVFWAAILIYAKNMLRNAVTLFPDSKLIHFLSWVVEFKFVKENNYLAAYYEHLKNKGQ